MHPAKGQREGDCILTSTLRMSTCRAGRWRVSSQCPGSDSLSAAHLCVERGRERRLAHQGGLLVLEPRILVEAGAAEEITGHSVQCSSRLDSTKADRESASERIAARQAESKSSGVGWPSPFTARCYSRIEMASWGSNRQDSLPPAYGRQASWSATDGWSHDAAAPQAPTAGYSFDNSTGAGPTATQAPAARPRAATNASGFADAAAVEGDDWELPPLERVQVVLKGDMQGWAFVKHHVWTVVHPDKGTSVERRYSDFVWLVESLTKRYPFRLLPALPPKRIQVSGHYLATDELFLERRRRGLERALTALLAHPVLKRDALVNAFMTEQRVRARPGCLDANVELTRRNERAGPVRIPQIARTLARRRVDLSDLDPNRTRLAPYRSRNPPDFGPPARDPPRRVVDPHHLHGGQDRAPQAEPRPRVCQLPRRARERGRDLSGGLATERGWSSRAAHPIGGEFNI